MNIYDFDNTIYDGDSSKDFFKYCLNKNKIILIDIIPICIMLFLYLVKVVEKEKFKSTFFKFLKRIDGNKYVIDFWRDNEYKIKDFYIKQHEKDDIIISASPYFLLEPIAKKYNFKLIATDMDIETGVIKGYNCYGEEKVKRLKNIGITKCNEFYSDSLSDTPCSKLAKESFVVKGNKLIPWNNYKLSNSKKIIKSFLNRDFITFVFIGVINAFNGIWIAYVYSLFITNAIVAYIAGFCTSLIIAYILNSKLNFKKSLNIKRFLKFGINNIPNFIIQVLSVILLLNKLEFNKLLAYAISTVTAVPITFILVKVNVFKKSNEVMK